jgi:hypothetical protein
MSGADARKACASRVEHPVHPSPVNADMESVQRIMLAATRPESVGESHKVLLVDRLQYRHDCLLDNLVLQAPGERLGAGWASLEVKRLRR